MSNNGDDFEDDLDPAEVDTFDEEQSAVDEGWDEFEDQPGEENLDDEDDSGEPAAKKKSGAFNKILIGVAVLVVGGVIALQFGKGAPAPVTPAQPSPEASVAAAEPAPSGMLGSDAELTKMAEMAKRNSNQPAPEASAPIATATPPSAPTPAAPSELATPEVVQALTPTETPNVPTPPMPTSVSAPEKQADAPPATPDVLDATPAPVKTEEAPTRMPSANDMMLKSSPSTTPDVTPAPAPTPSGNADTAALNMKMDQILSRLTSLEGEVSTLKQKPDTSGQMDNLRASVDTLEKRIASGVVVPKAAKKTADVKGPVTASATEPTEKPAPQILGAADSDPEINPVAGQVAKKATARPVKVSTSWVLKGAQPDQATVAKAGESDSRTVRVGDTLPGIGRITAVEFRDGRWSVIGTQGRVNQ
ncbi:MAG: hypothetical protein JWO78_598 [Micavibrio sp.]|nr:hypothetical protein [Micavibrio sp.]